MFRVFMNFSCHIIHSILAQSKPIQRSSTIRRPSKPSSSSSSSSTSALPSQSPSATKGSTTSSQPEVLQVLLCPSVHPFVHSYFCLRGPLLVARHCHNSFFCHFHPFIVTLTWYVAAIDNCQLIAFDGVRVTRSSELIGIFLLFDIIEIQNYHLSAQNCSVGNCPRLYRKINCNNSRVHQGSEKDNNYEL